MNYTDLATAVTRQLVAQIERQGSRFASRTANRSAYSPTPKRRTTGRHDRPADNSTRRPRHKQATIALRAGTPPRLIAGRLRHENPALTLSTAPCRSVPLGAVSKPLAQRHLPKGANPPSMASRMRPTDLSRYPVPTRQTNATHVTGQLRQRRHPHLTRYYANVEYSGRPLRAASIPRAA